METTRDPPRDPFQRFLPAPRNPRTSQRLPQRSPPGPQKPPRSATPPQGPQNPPESPRNTPNRPPRSHPGDTSGVRGQGDQAGHCPRAVCTLAAPGTLPKVGSALRERPPGTSLGTPQGPHGRTYVWGEGAGQVPAALALRGQRGAASRRLSPGAGREAEVHHRHGGREASIPRLHQPGVSQEPGGRRGWHGPATPPAAPSAIPGRRGVRALGSAGSRAGGASLLAGSSQLGDAQLEVQGLLQGMHGARVGSAGDTQGSPQGWRAPVPPRASPRPGPMAMPALLRAGGHGAAGTETVPSLPATLLRPPPAAGKGQGMAPAPPTPALRCPQRVLSVSPAQPLGP